MNFVIGEFRKSLKIFFCIFYLIFFCKTSVAIYSGKIWIFWNISKFSKKNTRNPLKLYILLLILYSKPGSDNHKSQTPRRVMSFKSDPKTARSKRINPRGNPRILVCYEKMSDVEKKKHKNVLDYSLKIVKIVWIRWSITITWEYCQTCLILSFNKFNIHDKDFS